MLHTKAAFFILLTGFSLTLKAQDSLSLFKTINNQYNTERDFKTQFYYNPASMSDYSSASFSEFNTGYHDNHEKIYRQQLGSGSKGLTVEAKSFQKLKPNRYVWGNASYQNLKINSVKWNETLDYDRVAPYTTADSVGGKVNLERYQFAGGYLQKMNRWTVAGQVSYAAQLGYRSKDPRMRSTTSDLKIITGLNYRVFRAYEVGVFGELNKYTQNNSVSFQSLLGRPYVYQMSGFGFSNYLFNGGTLPKNTFEEFAYKGGVQISGKGGQDFYIQASAGRGNNLKSYNDGSNNFFDITDLKSENFELEGAKFFTVHEKHRIGLLVNYKAVKNTGSEYGYSLNTVALTQIFKRESYRRENYESTIKGFYQYTGNNFSITAIPFFGHEEIKERRLYPDAGQKFVYSYFGINADVKKQIKDNQVLTFQPYFSKRTVSKSINALTATANAEVNAWLLQDFNFQASDISTYGASLRYDFKLEKLPAFFVSAQYQTQKLQKKNNNFAGASIGITF
ncbi:hypothetical protein B0A69_04710 [Chryseobacterium shigense]|uniref:DUF6850 domain-containing protein n=1 Tax=Chryseobacterium shigense TaxID=297244 RepID=A0A1N7IPA6_9FLAO|nr:DUF6850 family outer membrane beta-barrel protein [Chryseobacterium shigense]PQA95680.1 hypothetical protein B0A69_04710 [Chryseobacterium shigense]SIS38904.1 hypothetical protein SAMN05421639_104327 [Chryseobacterium shigense]